MTKKKMHLIFGQILPEFILLNFSLIIVLLLKNSESFFNTDSYFYLHDSLRLLLLFNAIWLGINLYNEDRDLFLSFELSKKIKYQILNIFLFLGIASTIMILFKIEYFNRTTLLLPVFIFLVLNLLFCNLTSNLYRRKGYHALSSKVLIIGAANNQQSLSKFLERMRPLGHGIVGCLDNYIVDKETEEFHILGKIEDLSEILESHIIDEIFINGSVINDTEMEKIVAIADYHGKRVSIIPEAPAYRGSNFKSLNLDGITIFQHHQTPLDRLRNFVLKKAFDFVFSLCVLILLSPIFLVIAILIRLDSKGAILYKPVRKGEGGRSFEVYKFRTMSECDDPLNGKKSTQKNDPRITRIGKYLRKYDLDELPQFYNVLKGDMSVVGPRPHRSFLQKNFKEIINDYSVRLYIKPGVTGWAQVNGWRGPTKTIVQKRERIKHDVWYIENWSLLLDVKIVFMTVFSRKSRQNAF